MMGMGLWWILILVALVALVVWIVRSMPGRSEPSTGRVTPEEILRQRYARGEIDDDEYQKRLRELRRT
jgi:putative membrane protein